MVDGDDGFLLCHFDAPLHVQDELVLILLNTQMPRPRLSAAQRNGINTMLGVSPSPHMTQERTAVMYQ